MSVYHKHPVTWSTGGSIRSHAKSFFSSVSNKVNVLKCVPLSIFGFGPEITNLLSKDQLGPIKVNLEKKKNTHTHKFEWIWW